MLQTRTIFTNVSKGVLAKEKDLEEAFGTTDAHAICLEILKKGELQVRGSGMVPCTCLSCLSLVNCPTGQGVAAVKFFW